MSGEAIGVLGLACMFVLLAAGMPIGISLAFVGFFGLAAVGGWSMAAGYLSFAPFSIISEFLWIVIPLFILMGNLAFASGLTKDTYEAANAWLGRLPGGLSIATIGGCAGFAACTGSSAASVGVITTTALPQMQRYNYDNRLATGCIAAGTTLGILIPPSIPMVVYGLFSGTSIGKLFMAGIVPGLLLTGMFVVTIILWVRISPSAGPSGPETTLSEKMASLKKTWSGFLLAAIVIVGIWGGIFTPIEAGGVGAFVAFLIALIRRRLNKGTFIQCLKDTVRISVMVMTILVGAILFNYFIAMTRLPHALADWVSGLQVAPQYVLLAIMLFYLVSGCLIDVLGLMLLTLPIFIPIIQNLGIDPILFGVLSTIAVEMAQITPPIGINVFILNGMAQDVPMYEIFMGIIPFLLCMMVCVGLIMIFPDIALFLPRSMGH